MQLELFAPVLAPEPKVIPISVGTVSTVGVEELDRKPQSFSQAEAWIKNYSAAIQGAEPIIDNYEFCLRICPSDDVPRSTYLKQRLQSKYSELVRFKGRISAAKKFLEDQLQAKLSRPVEPAKRVDMRSKKLNG